MGFSIIVQKNASKGAKMQTNSINFKKKRINKRAPKITHEDIIIAMEEYLKTGGEIKVIDSFKVDYEVNCKGHEEGEL